MNFEIKQFLPLPIGTYVQVTDNLRCHNYQVGGIYQVKRVDSDGTFIAADAHGVEGDFLHWDDCKPIRIDWEWLRKHLDDRSHDLLTAFDGLHTLRLKEECSNSIILATLNLADRILHLLPTMELNESAVDTSGTIPFDLDRLTGEE